ncbi:MAG: DNA adenine methylase, partial [Thermoplasmata archaeon]
MISDSAIKNSYMHGNDCLFDNNMKSLFPYYGGKFNQLKDILSIMREHLDSFDVVVDVFGGSAKVLLNIPDEWRKLKVYNDLDRDLFVTFRVLQ